jgi:hypothetical protein
MKAMPTTFGMQWPVQRHTKLLTIRSIDVGLREQLRIRTAAHGRSIAARLRAILRETRGPAIRRRFARFVGVEPEVHPPVAVGRPPHVGR